jgi:hypothetical protein
MATQNPSTVATSNIEQLQPEAREILTSRPPKILLKILPQLPSKYYLDLVHPSKALRNFIKINANFICNEAIRSRFSIEDTAMDLKLSSGWLVPRDFTFCTEKSIYCVWEKHGPGSYTRDPYKTKNFSILGPSEPGNLPLSLHSPGP